MNCATEHSREAMGATREISERGGRERTRARRENGPTLLRRKDGREGRAHIERERLHTREYVQELLRRCEALPESQSGLIRAIFDDGMAYARLAAVTGVTARSVKRRANRLAARVMSPEFEFVLEHSLDWTRTRQRVAHATIVLGCSFRQAALNLGLSLHVVRRHHVWTLAMCETARVLGERARAAGVLIGGRKPDGEGSREGVTHA
ncbi:MAG: hypothetical protein AABZ53_00200 [Planctomycetota bacterium]